MALIKSPEDYEKEQTYKVPDLAPDAKQIAKLDDPIIDIAKGMAERGFNSLWTEVTDTTSKLKPFNDEVKLLFIRHYATSGRLNFSATACGVSLYAVNYARKTDPIFKEAVAEAAGYFRDLLIGEMFRRGVTGYDEDVVCGKDRDQTIKVKKYSDKMLEMLAKVHMPELQRKQGEVRDKLDAPQTVNNVINNFDFTKLPPEDLKTMKALLENQAKRNADRGQTIEGEVVDGKSGSTT